MKSSEKSPSRVSLRFPVLLFFLWFSSQALATDVLIGKEQALNEFVATLDVVGMTTETMRLETTKVLVNMRVAALETARDAGKLTPKHEQQIHKILDDASPKFVAEYAEEMAKLGFVSIMEDALRSSYGKYLSDVELEQAALFYRSATGKKLIGLRPVLVAEQSKPGGKVVMERYFSKIEMSDLAAFSRSAASKHGHAVEDAATRDSIAILVRKTLPTLQGLIERHMSVIYASIREATR